MRSDIVDSIIEGVIFFAIVLLPLLLLLKVLSL